MNIRTINLVKGKIRIIDQTKLPLKLVYVDITRLPQLWKAIKIMQVRGAPALGAAAALGMCLGARSYAGGDGQGLYNRLEACAQYIGSSRPTARNLFWGIEQILAVAQRHQGQPAAKIKQAILSRAKQIMQEDISACRKIGSYGARLLKNNYRVLTICNAGALATIDYGTALGVIYSAYASGKKIKVYSCETRPLLQGARLSAWELHRQKVDVTLIADNTAAALMRQGMIDAVIAGADRIAANGDAANKIGTFNLAVLAHYHRIPFYIAAPKSTFDLSLKDQSGIRVEMRQTQEVTSLLFKRKIAPFGAEALNPAFDITPHQLIRAIITDYGLIRKINRQNIRKILKED